jgi:ubiquinone/menaquinone biosynthesis C-methylase UbiE
MAHRASNRERIQWTIELLEIKPDDRVLEVGFGPGMSIELVSNLAYRGFVAGIDHSEVMVRQATKRNTQAIRGGRVALHHGSVSKLPVFGTPFDKIFSINSIHFWNDSTQQLRELHRLMRPGGIIAVTLQPRSREATDDMAKQIGEEIITKLQTAGFSRCRLEIRKMKPVSAACAIGTS